MGYGDEVIASSLAKGALQRGVRIAFGDGQRLLLSDNAFLVLRRNPNIAFSLEGPHEWIGYYKGRRGYNTHNVAKNKWDWNWKWRMKPGEFYFTAEELAYAAKFRAGFVLIEPYPALYKPTAPNKQWPLDRWRELVRRLLQDGHDVRQFSHTNRLLDGCKPIAARSFRDVAAIVQRAALVITPEGGLHHTAAAVNTPAVVLFGAWIPHTVMGYEAHANIGNDEGCGKLSMCPHCVAYMRTITVDEVYAHAREKLNVGRTILPVGSTHS